MPTLHFPSSPKQNLVDGHSWAPGDSFEIPLGYTTPLHFVGLRGTKENPIVIRGGGLTIPINLSYAVKFDDCQHFIFTGTKIQGGNLGVTCEKRSTDFELSYLTISSTGSVGILAKDNQSFLGEFVMRNVKIHHCTFVDTGTESMYIGNSSTVDASTGKRNHLLEDVEIHHNIFKNSGWEAIQLGCCSKGASIHDNQIENYGIAPMTPANKYQHNGIQIGEGTGGVCYSNILRGGVGNGIICLGIGGNVIYKNTLLLCGENGVYADDRPDTTAGFKFLDNVIVGAKIDGIKCDANKGLINEARNNIILNPGRKYINKSPEVILNEFNNYCKVDKELGEYFIQR